MAKDMSYFLVTVILIGTKLEPVADHGYLEIKKIFCDGKKMKEVTHPSNEVIEDFTGTTSRVNKTVWHHRYVEYLMYRWKG